MVDYCAFATTAMKMIGDRFSVKSLSEKAFMLFNDHYKPSTEVDSIPMSKLDLFKIFKQYDRN